MLMADMAYYFNFIASSNQGYNYFWKVGWAVFVELKMVQKVSLELSGLLIRVVSRLTQNTPAAARVSLGCVSLISSA